jgi:GGDEF domain-containing protein
VVQEPARARCRRDVARVVLARPARDGNEVAVAFADADRLKAIDENFGPAEHDRAIR